MAERSRRWLQEELEMLVGWMEENQASLSRKQSIWHKQVKDQVFADNDEITPKRIKEKAQNMKASWKVTRKLKEKSGSGWKPEDNSLSFVALLEKKCPFFWRLDKVWGTCPNTSTPILSVASTHAQRAADTVSNPAADTPSHLAADTPSHPAADTPSHPAADAHSHPAADTPSHPAPDTPSHPAPNTPFNSAADTPPQRAAGASSPQNSSVLEYEEILEVSSVQGAEPGGGGTPPPEGTKKTRRGSSVSPTSIDKRKRSKEIERFLGERAAMELESEERRAKLERELQKERLEAEEQRMERQLESMERIQREKLEAEERIARIHAEAQAKQFQAFMDMMTMVSGPRRTAE